MVAKGQQDLATEQRNNKIHLIRTSLVVQWIRICLPMQGTPGQSLVWEDSTRCGATKPKHRELQGP